MPYQRKQLFAVRDIRCTHFPVAGGGQVDLAARRENAVIAPAGGKQGQWTGRHVQAWGFIGAGEFRFLRMKWRAKRQEDEKSEAATEFQGGGKKHDASWIRRPVSSARRCCSRTTFS